MREQGDNRKPRLLDLDELFGQDAPLVVRWDGREWELRPAQAMGPADLLALDRLQKRQAALGGQFDALPPDAQDRATVELDDVLRGMLGLMCPELAARRPPFAAVMRVVEFYVSQLTGGAEGDPDPKATGGMPSPS